MLVKVKRIRQLTFMGHGVE